MNTRFETARQYLIELLKAYGHRSIIVKINQNGDEIKAMAKSFVKRHLTAVEIELPFDKIKRNSTKILNPDLDSDELSIIFHKAVFEIEEAYLEEFCLNDPEKEAFINAVQGWIERKKEWIQCTFSYYSDDELMPFLDEEPEPKLKLGDLSVGLEVLEEDLKVLKNMGYTQISSEHSMTQVIWAFASQRKPIEKLMRNAILSITVDEEAAEYLHTHYKYYNRFIQDKIEKEKYFSDKKIASQLTKIHQNELLQLKNKHQKELKELREIHKRDIAERKRKYQLDLQKRLRNSKDKAKKYERVVKKFRQELFNPLGRFFEIYDFTKEEDIKVFISWYGLSHSRIKNQTVKNIIRIKFSDDEDKAELLRKLVDEYNSGLITDEEDIEEQFENDIEDEDENNTDNS